MFVKLLMHKAEAKKFMRQRAMDLGLASCAFAAPPVVEPATSGTSGGATDEGKGEAKEEEAKEEEAKEEDDPMELFDDFNLVF